MRSPNDPIRVLLVEDHPMFRDQLQQLIAREGDMAIVGQVDNKPEALVFLKTSEVDIVILDITLRESSGLELLKDMQAEGVNAPVLVLSMHDELLYAERVLRAGARGYISKHETSAGVMAAIRQVLAGQIYVGKRANARMLEAVAQRYTAVAGVNSLTDRELEVFELIGRGKSTRQIGNSLHLGLSTVDTYRARIKSKLNLENGSQLVHEAIRWISDGQRSPG